MWDCDAQLRLGFCCLFFFFFQWRRAIGLRALYLKGRESPRRFSRCRRGCGRRVGSLPLRCGETGRVLETPGGGEPRAPAGGSGSPVGVQRRAFGFLAT